MKGRVPANKTHAGKKSTTVASKNPSTSPSNPTSSRTKAPKVSFMASSCSACGIVIQENVKALQCDRCQADKWKCSECLNLPLDLYDHLVSDPNCPLRWFCDECDEHVMGTNPTPTDQDSEKLSKLIDLIESFHTKLSGFEDSQKRIEDKVDRSFNLLDDKLLRDWSANVERSHKRIDEKVETLVNMVEEKSVEPDRVSDYVGVAVRAQLLEDRDEEEEMKKRKTSIIVHGLDEPAGVTTENRIENDKVVVEQLLHVISADEVSVNHMIRLGKRPEEVSAKPRPVKLVLASEDQKQKVLAKAKNLKDRQEGGWHRVFIHQDLTPRQREMRKKAVGEMKLRQSQGETNLTVINGRVVVRKPRPYSVVSTDETNQTPQSGGGNA